MTFSAVFWVVKSAFLGCFAVATSGLQKYTSANTNKIRASQVP